MSDFDPGTRVLKAGFQLAPPFRSLPVDVLLEKDVAVQLRDGVTIYVDVLRPVGPEKVPVIVAWSPYGKGQGTSQSVMGVFAIGLHRDGIAEDAAKLVEAAGFVGGRDQLPVSIPGRNLDSEDRRAVVGRFAARERRERDGASGQDDRRQNKPRFRSALLHDATLRERKSRISGTISSALSSSAKWPVSMR